MPRSKRTADESFLPDHFRRPNKRPGAATDNPSVQALWHVISTIPRGQVSTYGAVARAAGLPGRARQTGYALRIAPKGMHLPWYRVLGAGGRISFPKSSRNFQEQARHLKSEGVEVKGGRVAPSAICDLGTL
jgi:methylated-DNA-protein-cysteine methyltransferase related protein